MRYVTKLYLAGRLHRCPFYLVPERDMFRTESLHSPSDSVSASMLRDTIKGTELLVIPKCGLVQIHLIFIGAFCLHHKGRRQRKYDSPKRRNSNTSSSLHKDANFRTQFAKSITVVTAGQDIR